MVDRRIVPDLRWIAQRFPIYVTDGYSGPLPNGEHVGCHGCHVKGSDHYNGLAVDIVPLERRRQVRRQLGRRSPASPTGPSRARTSPRRPSAGSATTATPATAAATTSTSPGNTPPRRSSSSPNGSKSSRSASQSERKPRHKRPKAPPAPPPGPPGGISEVHSGGVSARAATERRAPAPVGVALGPRERPSADPTASAASHLRRSCRSRRLPGSRGLRAAAGRTTRRRLPAWKARAPTSSALRRRARRGQLERRDADQRLPGREPDGRATWRLSARRWWRPPPSSTPRRGQSRAARRTCGSATCSAPPNGAPSDRRDPRRADPPPHRRRPLQPRQPAAAGDLPRAPTAKASTPGTRAAAEYAATGTTTSMEATDVELSSSGVARPPRRSRTSRSPASGCRSRSCAGWAG